MSTQYNIYRIKLDLVDNLKLKISTTELVEQKTIASSSFTSTFYYSENVKGNDVWWWKTYNPYINNLSIKPTNKFYYGLLISIPNDNNSEFAYLISLGKSHFYLNEFIERDFGINLAIRMANEKSVLLKKSTYFSSIKKGDVSSYQKFIADNYEPGESVDHLKLKASDTKIWGDKNLIFSDSVQLSDDIPPSNIELILSRIELAMNGEEIISLPKLEMVKRESDVEELDDIVLTAMKTSHLNFSISEFEVIGHQILLSQDNYNYELFTRIGNGPYGNKEKIGNNLDAEQIKKYINNIPDTYKLEHLKLRFEGDTFGSRTTKLKEALEYSTTFKDENYFLRNGLWYKFNQTFMNYIKYSLDKITTSLSYDLIESDYADWKEKKINFIEQCKKNNSQHLLDNKLTYREYYFNKLMSDSHGYELWDRDNKTLPSINEDGINYKVEIADLYLDGEVISLKISEDTSDLIYNVAQSTTAIELTKNKAIDLSVDLKTASLWFVFEKDINKITEFNSVQLLIAVERWKQTVLHHNLEPKIIISKHIK